MLIALVAATALATAVNRWWPGAATRRRGRRSRQRAAGLAAFPVAGVRPGPAVRPRRHRLRPDDRHPGAIDLDRQGRGRAVRAADRRQPGVSRPGAVERRRRLRLVVRVVRLAQPLDAELRSRRAHAAGRGLRLDLAAPAGRADGAAARPDPAGGDRRPAAADRLVAVRRARLAKPLALQSPRLRDRRRHLRRHRDDPPRGRDPARHDPVARSPTCIAPRSRRSR